MAKKIKIKFFFNDPNWGDKIAPYLVEMIAGNKPNMVEIRKPYSGMSPINLTVGSVLNYCDDRSIVWGAGFLRAEDVVLDKPFKVCAVRGPLSREKLLDLGIDCPKIYGDPVLLLPKFYKPKKLPQKKLGIIKHYEDHDFKLPENLLNDDVRLIDIFDDCFKVVDEITSCDFIVSSSLHGIIVADAYGIPAYWVTMFGKLKGGNFKFLDYFASVGRKDARPYQITKNTTMADLYNLRREYKIDIDLKKLLEVCPFKKEGLKV